MSAATEAATIRLENRALQALLVATVGTLSWLLVAMFDRLEGDIVDLTDSISALEDENAERDSKLAELVLQIERRLTVLENQ
jgi:hypothetical protein